MACSPCFGTLMFLRSYLKRWFQGGRPGFMTRFLTPLRACSDPTGPSLRSRRETQSSQQRTGGRMQPGVVGVRSAVTALWAEDLGAVREDRYDTDRGKEALAFIQRFNAMVSHLRGPIQQAWGPGGLVHVADNPDVAGPGQRVSQVRVKLRNHGDAVVSEGFGYSAGSPSANPSLGLDREIKVDGIGAFQFVQELYGTLVGFLQTALNVDLALANSLWLYEQVGPDYFVAHPR